MFDTAIIYKTVTRKTVKVIINRLKALICRQRRFKNGAAISFQASNELQRYGVKYLSIVNQLDDNYANVYISLSLQGLCSGDSEHLFLPYDDNIRLLTSNFDRIMKELGIVQGTCLEAWTLSRLDFAVDIKTPDANQYVQLMKKAKQPYHYKLLCDKAGSFYSGTQKSTTVLNHYDKTNERKSRGLQDGSDESSPIMRLEVQIKATRKMADLKKRHNLKGKSLLDFLQIDVAKDVIERHDERFGLTGDYFSIVEATRLIKASGKQKQTKERMIAFLTKVTKCKNVNAACKLYERETGKSSTDLLRSLRKLGINPVTIPCRENTPRLPGIVSLVEDEFDKLEAKNQVFQDGNCLFPRNENNVETLHQQQLFVSRRILFAGISAFSDDKGIAISLRMCIFSKLSGKNKDIEIAKGSHAVCDWYGNSNTSHYRGPP